MMIIFIVSISLLLIFGVSLLVIRRYVKKNYIKKETIVKALERKELKRGIYESTFTWKGGVGAKDVIVNTVVEFEVIDETREMVKLKAISVNVNDYSYFSESNKKSYMRCVNDTWFDKTSNKLRFFKDDEIAVRNKKLDKLIGPEA